jgi:hypothetical protein
MPPPDFFIFLRTSLSVLSEEEPEAHRALAAALGNLKARLVADGVARTIRVDSLDWTIYSGVGDADLEVAFDRRSILDLIGGSLTMEDAISLERLRMRGPVETIERFHRALMIYLEGLIRAPGTRAILIDYQME